VAKARRVESLVIFALLGRKISDKPLLCQLEVAGVMATSRLGEIGKIGTPVQKLPWPF
jgi:hypothetical protein